MLTVQLAHELRDTPIKVNAADPGYTATDLNGHRGVHTVEAGAVMPMRLALLPAHGPTGGFLPSMGRSHGERRPTAATDRFRGCR